MCVVHLCEWRMCRCTHCGDASVHVIQRVEVCWRVMQRVAVWCSVVQCGAVWSSVVQCVAVWGSELWCVALTDEYPSVHVVQCGAVCSVWCSVLLYSSLLQGGAIWYCSVLQIDAVCCGVLQCVAVFCSVLLC